MSIIYANPEFIHTSFVLIPKEGCVDKIIAELSTFSKWIETNEPGTLSYSISKAKPLDMEGHESDGPEQIVVYMIFRDEASVNAHKSSEEQTKFTERMSVFKDDLAAPPKLQSLKPAGGFVMKK